MSLQTENLLKKHQIRFTAARQDVVDAFIKMGRALSHSELEEQFDSSYDRVTLYRTLKTFVEAGIIHKVLDGAGTRYALCADACAQHHQHDHVHFKCSTCGETNCLTGVHIPKVSLPKGYILNDLNFLAEGICPKCV